MNESEKLVIRPLQKTNLLQVKDFCDLNIGFNYYSLEELEKILHQSTKNNIICSFILENPQKLTIHGVRITYPPGQWAKGKGTGLTPHLWKVSLNETAYFQSLFIAPEFSHKGWGKKLSLASIDVLKNLETKAIITHSWKESPNDSSGKYLRGLGFSIVATHPHYWIDVNYNCTRCLKPPCRCTAEEMIKYL